MEVRALNLSLRDVQRKVSCRRWKALLCFWVFRTHLKLALQIQLQVDGNSGLKRAVILQGAPRVSYGNFAVDKFHRLQVTVGSYIDFSEQLQRLRHKLC